MLSTVDAAILEALSLEPTSTKLIPHGSSSFASTYKLTSTTLNGRDLTYFVKIGTGPSADVMLRGERASLNAIHDAVPGFCPRSLAHGAMGRASEGRAQHQESSSSGRYFLVTEFLEVGIHLITGSGMSLAEKLAKLHTTPAPIPRGYDKPMYGFPVATCCGATVQENGWKESWAEFYADNRLRAILKEGVRKNGNDRELTAAVEKVAETVVPRLLGDGHLKGVRPVLVHGDLWSGNHGEGRAAGKGGAEEVVFDPSCVYGHSEYELGIMRMFGGFGSGFWREYEKLVPKSEPKEEFEDRVALYELYHHLNHFALFGGGYRSGAMSIMKKLISKYGS